MPLYGDEKREYQRKWRKAKSDRLKAEGRCIYCGKELDGTTYRCQACNRMKHEKWDKRCLKKIKDEGRCLSCGKTREQYKLFCNSCHEKRMETARIYVDSRDADGLCTTCGVPWEYSRTCPNCSIKKVERKALLRSLKV